MKHKTGDKFIIEIESILDEQVGLYKIRGFRTLVFDDYGLNMLKQIHECDGCKYERRPSYVFPCNECKQNMIDHWTPKAEEIQVGDEVEHNSGEKAVVFRVTEQMVYALYQMPENPFSTLIRCEWYKETCKRTGKTYPELIKALEQLPKDGE